MFGQTGNTSFGFNPSSQSSPFGQSAFGKTVANSSFGTSTAPVFGTNTPLFSAKSTGPTTGSLFGNTTTSSTFGTSTAPQQAFGGFSNSNTNTSLFGSQQSTNTNLFGCSTAASTFGQGNKPTTFGFGQSSGTSLFGQSQQQNTQQALPFGQAAAPGNAGLFGTNAGFGTSSTTSTITGTIVKFNPVTGTDTMVKNGTSQTISTRHHCITCMKEYESKSLEELRLEDYSVGRKGVAQGQSPSIFGTTTQNPSFGTVVSGGNSTNTGFGVVSSGFGASSNSGLFSKPVSGFGAPVTTSSTFAFNSTTSSNLFNSQSKSFGNASTPLFASSSTSTPGSAFGSVVQNPGFGTGFNTAPSNQNIGLFSQNKTAFSLPSSTSNTSFGFGQSSTTTANNLFNSKSLGTGFGSTFGGSTNPTFQSTNVGFGSAQNTNSTLFNSSFKPVVQSGGFTFGNTPNTASTGIGSTGNSLFNSSTKPNLFSNNSTTTFNNSGTFGPAQTFGTATNSVSLLGTNIFGSGLSVNNVQHSNGSIPVHQQILALVSAPFGDSPLLKNLLPASGKSEQFLKPSNSVTKGLSNSNHKVFLGKTKTVKPKISTTNSLSKKSLFDGLEDEDPLLGAFQPRPNAKRLILRPKPSILNELNDFIQTNEKANGSNTETDFQILDKENKVQNSEVGSLGRTSSFWIRSSFPKRDEIFEKEDPIESKISDLPSVVENTIAELRSSDKSEYHTSGLIEHSSKDSCNMSAEKNNFESNTSETALRDASPDTSRSLHYTSELENKANVKLERHGYYTIPALKELYKYVKNETCVVPHFTVGRKGYGNVYFADSFDIYGLNLDEIVHFRHKEVIIYPDDETKPPVGQGLNRKAQVTLDRVWPHDKSQHQPINDPKRLIDMDYEGKLRRVSSKHGTRFLEYRPETGSWVFKVDHFSKYGLSDSDEDEPLPNNNVETKMKTKNLRSFSNDSKEENLFHKNNSSAEQSLTTFDDNDIGPHNIDLYHYNSDNEYLRDTVRSTTAIHGCLSRTNTHTLQLMKASFFEFIDENRIQDAFTDEIQDSNQRAKTILKTDMISNEFERTNEQYREYFNLYGSFENWKINKKSEFHTHDNSEKNVQTEIKKICSIKLRPRVFSLQSKSYDFSLVPIENNYIQSKYIADLGIQTGNFFKNRWAPNLTLWSIRNKTVNSSISQHLTSSQSSVINLNKKVMKTTKIQQIQLPSENNEDREYNERLKAIVDDYLNIQLEYSKIDNYEDNIVISIVPMSSIICALNDYTKNILHNTCMLKEDPLIKQFCNIWKLTESLWGRLAAPLSGVNKHKIEMLRKESLSEWLKEVTEEMVEREISTMENNDEIIFSLLSAHKLDEACIKALESGDHCLALLLAQLEGTCAVQDLIRHQIKLWQDAEIDNNFTEHRMKLFMLIAGKQVISDQQETINVCENLDWKRTFAIHLWFLQNPVSSISDVLDFYDKIHLESLYTPSPYFEYNNKECNNKNTYDLCYHLLKLYCTGNYQLESIFNPQTHTNNILDYRLSWMLYQVLTSLGYTHMSHHVSALLHSNFAAQLESQGLWHWAIFVALHLTNSHQRQQSVMDLLLRHVQLDSNSCYKDKEIFLEEKLNIPTKWINYAKGIKASSCQRFEEAAYYLIEAEKWNEAHEIIMTHIVTDAIISGDHVYLKSLFNLLISRNGYNFVSGWSHQGQLVWDYITIIEEMEDLIKKKNFSKLTYNLELLKPQLVSLCSKINLFPSQTSKHRLCQVEMAKRTIQLARGLIILISKEEYSSNFFIKIISQLPLPEDYAQQELESIIKIVS